MAEVSSGNFICNGGSTGGYSGRTTAFFWSVKSQSIENNTTTISWLFRGYGTTTGFTFCNSCKHKLVINGTTVIPESRYPNLNAGINISKDTEIAKGEFTIQHNADGTASFSASAQSAVYYSRVNAAGSGSWELPKIARMAQITAASNFTDEDYPTLSYTVPVPDLVDKLEVCIAKPDGSGTYVPYREVPIEDGSYTFQLTEQERTNLRNACVNANSMTVRYYIRTTMLGTTYLNNVTKTLTIVNAQPTMTASVVDNGSVSKTLTGNVNSMIKGYNTMYATMTATAYKGATITSRKITNGGTTVSGASGTFGYTEINTFVFTATDSRGNIVSKTITVPMVNYFKLSCVFKLDSFNADGTGKLLYSGNFFNGSFGAVYNELTIQYRYRTNGGDYSEWFDAESSINGNAYTGVANLSGFDYRNSYTFQGRAVDKINTVVSQEEKVKIFPLFDWGADSFSFNMPVEGVSINGISMLDLLHPIGSVYISRSAVSPAEIFGGYWRQIKDKFILAAGDTYASGSTGGAATHTLTTAEMPSHSHTQSVVGTRSGSGSTYVSWNASNVTGSTAGSYSTTFATGGGGAHNNMPPYLTLYVWERVRELTE